MVTDETYVCNQLYSIPLADLKPDPDQPRKYFDPAALEELTASIARNNVMTPILFRIQDGKDDAPPPGKPVSRGFPPSMSMCRTTRRFPSSKIWCALT